MEKKHYELLIKGDGINRYPLKYIDVHCTQEELAIIAKALISYIHNVAGGGCVCLAKTGGEVSLDDYDFMFSDCI